MSLVFPVATGAQQGDTKLSGSAVTLGPLDDNLLLATALHCLSDAQEIFLVIPPHGGDCTERQTYPTEEMTGSPAEIANTNPFADLAILEVPLENLSGGMPPQEVSDDPDALSVGDEVVVLGYPFAPLGSALETWTPGYVTALGERQTAPGVNTDELVLSTQAHPGISGGAVVGKEDGLLHGIIRGALAPPSVIKTAGNVSLGTDSSVTFATSSHHLTDLIQDLQEDSPDA